MRAVFVAAAALGALALASSPAHAYCRTTTSKAPAGYNPAESGCWTEGVPLSWTDDRVPYAVDSAASKQVSLSAATRVADLAFSAWNGTLCDEKSPGIEAYDEGPSTSVPDGSDGDALAQWASCSESTSCNASAHDVIVFDDDAWPYDDPANTLALTTVTYGVEDGHIFQAYTEVNSAEHTLTTSEPPPAGGTTYDLQAILTHEAGHFLGLAHATETTAIMYAFYQPGAITLTPDDIDAVCGVYPPTSPKGASCSTAGGVLGDASPLGGLSCLLAAIAWSVRRHRRRLGLRERFVRLSQFSPESTRRGRAQGPG